MKRLKVISKDNYDYVLLDTDDKRYYKNIEFYDVKVKVGDYICMPQVILDQENIFTFGPLVDSSVNADDIIKVINSEDEIYMQRYYG